MHTVTKHVRAHWLAFALVILASVVSLSAIVFADVISGLSTTNSSTNVTITNLTLNKPSDVSMGDFMLASIAIYDGSAVSVTAPSGWAPILRTDNSTDVGIATYWKVADASEPANYTWLLSPQTRAEGGITRYSGVDPLNPIEATAGNTGHSKVAATAPVTTTTPNDVLVAVYALHVGNNAHAGDFFSTPTGMTENYDSSNTATGPTIATFNLTQIAPGIAPSESSNIAGGPQRDWASQHIALRPLTSSLNQGLLHYWKLDESSGDAFDGVGSMTLTNHNATSFTPGHINNGADFESDNQNFFRTSEDLTNTPLTAYSMCMWYKPETTPVNEQAYSLWQSYDTPGLFDVQYFTPGGGSVTLSFRHFVPIIESTEAITILHPVVLNTNNFSHICATWDGSATSLYLNNVLVGTQSADTIRTNETTFGTTLGAQSVNDVSSFQHTDGIIDEVGFWNRALTPSEISELYNSGMGKQYPF